MQVTASHDITTPQTIGDRDAQALDTSFIHTLKQFGPFGPAPHLAIALSGGADSMALALLAHDWARAHGGHITTLTIDHGLRPESRREAEQVAEWMQARSIAHHILTPPPAQHSNNLQENARQRRYDALADWCRAHDVLHCLIAHHAGDQRETISHNLARGDTADGASGMSAIRNYRSTRFLRPLLNCEREQLQTWLEYNGAPWVEDPSNRNAAFARVRNREALAADAAARAALTQRAAEEATTRAARDNALAAIAATLVTLSPNGTASLPLAAWQALEPEAASRLIADLLTTISGATERPRRNDTARLCEALNESFRRRTLHGCTITLKKSILHIAREPARMASLSPLTGTGTARWDNRFALHYRTPAGVTLDTEAVASHITRSVPLPEGTVLAFGFAPAKPLAAAPFWWLK